MATILTILLSARDAGDFSEAAGEWEMAPKCGSLPRNAGDLVGLRVPWGRIAASGFLQSLFDAQQTSLSTERN